MHQEMIEYQSGFGNDFATESLKGALPIGQNSPQKAPFGLYPEQLSGSAFTVGQRFNLRSWFYRIRPSVVHSDFRPLSGLKTQSAPFRQEKNPPNQLRWDPLPIPSQRKNFIESWVTYAGNGDIGQQTGCGIHLYACNASMTDTYFYNSDGDLLIVPQEGRLFVSTECGVLEVSPKEIIVIPRGFKFKVELPDSKARGYICENYGSHFQLPDRGPIGANGLANSRDFLAPLARYEESSGTFRLINKFCGNYWEADLKHSPLDVVAWHGNYTPYKYDLERFNTMGSISFDHPDPSIFTVLTSPSYIPGTANIDFVIFPKRWMVAENTFRPPYYHRNVMSEFMGLIYGVYDAKEKGFEPGGASLHNCMSPHGPEATVFEKATNSAQKPELYDHTLAFMFECRSVFQVTQTALESPQLQKNYIECWQGLKSQFRRN